ncbi:MAG: T9SS type A sorting domain-containing protein, partial [Flavobacteriales bacterium]
TGSGCGTAGTPISGTEQYFAIPQRIVNYLGANNTIGDLLQLANQALAGNYVATTGNPTLSDITSALDAINRGFDGCRNLVGFSNTGQALARTAMPVAPTAQQYLLEAERMLHKAYPNPFDRTTVIEFSVADYSQQVTVEVRSLDGELVARLYDAPANGGETIRVTFDAAEMASGVYVYRIISGDLVRYDKLLLQK